MKKNCCTEMVLLATLIIALLFLAGALILAFVGIPLIIKSQVKSQVALKDGTDQWDRFKELPFAIDFQVYIWEVTNPDEIVQSGAKPILKQKGPYWYNEHKKKNLLSFDNDEDSVTYENTIEMEFNQEKSGELREDDLVTIINPIFQTAVQITNQLEVIVLAGCMDKLLHNDDYDLNNLFITVKIKDLLFDGLFYAIDSDSLGVACKVVRSTMIEKSSRIKVVDIFYKSDSDGDEPEVDRLKFSMFSFKTEGATHKEGNLTVVRGRDNVKKLGNHLRWKGSSTIDDMWGTATSINNDTCMRMRGTDTTLFHPGIKKTEVLETFTSDICRVVELSYVQENTYQDITGYRFEPTEVFSSATPNPENDCYCTKSVKDVDGNPSCFLDGTFDYEPCLGAPNLISSPHFLDANQTYSDNIDGLSPDPDKHRIFLLVEPNTGIPLEGHKRVQINTVLRPIKGIHQLDNVPKVVFPIVWVDEGIQLPQKYVDMLNDEYFNKVKLADGLKYGFIAATATVSLVALVFYVRKKWYNRIVEASTSR